MQGLYKSELGQEDEATFVAHNRYKLLKDMHCEAQVKCFINFIANFSHQRIIKRCKNFEAVSGTILADKFRFILGFSTSLNLDSLDHV